LKNKKRKFTKGGKNKGFRNRPLHQRLAYGDKNAKKINKTIIFMFNRKRHKLALVVNANL